ncbi:MAG: DUF6304 family protein [Candidatus Kapaibacterium sp.]
MEPAAPYDYDSGEFPAFYCDAFGCEHVVLRKIRGELSVTIRGVEFSGDVDELTTNLSQGSPELESFTFRPTPYGSFSGPDYIAYELAEYTLEWDMLISVSVQGCIETGTLTLRLRGLRNEPRSYPITTLILRYSGGTSVTRVGEFESMLNLQKQLPEGDHIRACITCLFSDYWIAGQPLYGGMGCFVEIKDIYLSCQDKDDLINLWNNYESPAVTETYLCPKFELRIPGTGYRG